MDTKIFSSKLESVLPAVVMCIDPGFFLTFPILTDLLGSHSAIFVNLGTLLETEISTGVSCRLVLEQG